MGSLSVTGNPSVVWPDVVITLAQLQQLGDGQGWDAGLRKMHLKGIITVEVNRH